MKSSQIHLFAPLLNMRRCTLCYKVSTIETKSGVIFTKVILHISSNAMEVLLELR